MPHGCRLPGGYSAGASSRGAPRLAVSLQVRQPSRSRRRVARSPHVLGAAPEGSAGMTCPDGHVTPTAAPAPAAGGGGLLRAESSENPPVDATFTGLDVGSAPDAQSRSRSDPLGPHDGSGRLEDSKTWWSETGGARWDWRDWWDWWDW